MKKIISLLAVFVMLFGLSTEVFAEENAGISFKKYYSEETKTYSVDVILSGNSKPAMIQFCVAYDSDVLECTSVVAGNIFSSTLAPTINRTLGKIYIVWDALSPLEGSGIIARLEFSVKTFDEDGSVWIDTTEEDFVILTYDFEEIITEIGSITVSEKNGSESYVSGTESSGQQSSEQESSKQESEASSESDVENDSSQKDEEENVNQEVPPDITPEQGFSQGIEIDKTSLSLVLGEEALLSISGTDKEVLWYSSDESVAVVEDGKVVSVGPGVVTITVITEDGEGQATCIVTVTDNGEKEEQKTESEENSLVVDSPRGENPDTEKTPIFVYFIIIVLGFGIAAVGLMIYKKLKKDKN